MELEEEIQGGTASLKDFSRVVGIADAMQRVALCSTSGL